MQQVGIGVHVTYEGSSFKRAAITVSTPPSPQSLLGDARLATVVWALQVGRGATEVGLWFYGTLTQVIRNGNIVTPYLTRGMTVIVS
jgi:hypothetical protein